MRCLSAVGVQLRLRLDSFRFRLKSPSCLVELVADLLTDVETENLLFCYVLLSKTRPVAVPLPQETGRGIYVEIRTRNLSCKVSR